MFLIQALNVVLTYLKMLRKEVCKFLLFPFEIRLTSDTFQPLQILPKNGHSFGNKKKVIFGLN